MNVERDGDQIRLSDRRGPDNGIDCDHYLDPQEAYNVAMEMEEIAIAMQQERAEQA